MACGSKLNKKKSPQSPRTILGEAFVNNTQFHLYAGWVFLNYKVRLSSNLHARHRHLLHLHVTRSATGLRLGCVFKDPQNEAQHTSTCYISFHVCTLITFMRGNAPSRNVCKDIEQRVQAASCCYISARLRSSPLAVTAGKEKKKAAIPGSSTLVSAYPPTSFKCALVTTRA